MDFFCQISNGKITKHISVEDGYYFVSIKSKKARSLQQNKYYWAVMVPLVKIGLAHIGYDEIRTNEDAHNVIKGLFLKKEIVNKISGEVMPGGYKSTTELNTLEFNELIESVQKWAVEYLGIDIPNPNEKLILFT